MQKNNLVFWTYALTICLVFSGCNAGSSVPTEGPDITIQDNTEIMPSNIINIGDSFEYFPDKATGHFVCSVADAWVVTDPSQCPPQEKVGRDYNFLMANVNGDYVTYAYDEYLTDGGAYDQGCRLVMVDLVVTNVDAEAEVYVPNAQSTAWFSDTDAFYSYMIVSMANLSVVNKDGAGVNRYNTLDCFYFSQYGSYSSEDIQGSYGIEPWALQLAPKETARFTLGYVVNTNYDGSRIDLSMLMLCAGTDTGAETGTFIALNLEG